MTGLELLKEAMEASKNSYSPYSNVKVGAALVTKDGKVVRGCNIENVSYGLSNCAERTCLFTAYAMGIRKEDIVAFAEYTPMDHVFTPCGACRQVMSELLNKDVPVYLGYGSLEDIYVTSVAELLPMSCKKEDIL